MNVTDRSRARLATVLGLTLVLGACVQIRLLTYPSEFVWLGEEEVQDVMHVMAGSMARLDALLEPDGSGAPDDPSRRRQAVDAELATLEELGAALALGTVGEGERSLPRTNHLLIDEHIDRFIDDVVRARRFLVEEPPNYYAAGRLSGSCTACHRWRGDAT